MGWPSDPPAGRFSMLHELFTNPLRTGDKFLSGPLLGAGLFLLALLAAACVSPRSGQGTPAELGGPEYSALMVSSDLAKGPNRLAFALVNRNNVPVNAPEAQVRLMYTPPGATEAEERGVVTATFLPWPPEGGNRGVFVADVGFDVAGEATQANPGLWELRVSATAADGATVEAATAVRVAQQQATPAVGEPAPRSVTPVASDVPDLAHITSAPEPDPAFYQLSVHEALDQGKPLVVLFSTPAFCVSATCGPQLDILARLKDRYGDRANFIHVEVFEDPHLIEGNRFSARQAPAVEEWGLPTEPWTFIVDGDGRVSHKFEQFTPEEVLEAALETVL